MYLCKYYEELEIRTTRYSLHDWWHCEGDGDI